MYTRRLSGKNKSHPRNLPIRPTEKSHSDATAHIDMTEYQIVISNHSFILDISIAPPQVHYYSEALLTTALILCQSSHAEVLQATASEELSQGPSL